MWIVYLTLLALSARFLSPCFSLASDLLPSSFWSVQGIWKNEWVSHLQLILRNSRNTYRITVAFQVAASYLISSRLRSGWCCRFVVHLGISLEPRVYKCSISHQVVHCMIVGTHAFKLLIDCADSCLSIFIGQTKTSGEGFGVDFLVFVLVCVEPILHLTGSKVDLGGRLISKIDSHHLKAVDFTFGWTSNNRGLPSSKTGVIILIVLEPFDDYKVVIFLQVTSSFVSILICRGIITSGFLGFLSDRWPLRGWFLGGRSCSFGQGGCILWCWFYLIGFFFGGMILARARSKYEVSIILGWNWCVAYLAGNKVVKKWSEEGIGLNRGRLFIPETETCGFLGTKMWI